MVARVHDGGLTSMSSMMFGMSSMYNSNDAKLLSNTINPSVLSSTSTFFNDSTNYINKLYQSEEVISQAKKVIQNHGSALNKYVITNIDYNNITTANDMMKTVIASNPNVMKLDRLGVLEGYTATPINLELVDYVNSGVCSITDVGFEYSTYSSSAFDDYDDDDRYAIIRCWETVNELLAKGIDPTSSDLNRY